MPDLKAAKIETEDILKIDEVNFSERDYQLLTSTIAPKCKRNFFRLALIYIALIPVMPYFPGKITGALIESMSYRSALTVSCCLTAALICLLYYYMVVNLMRDIKDGYKCVYRTTVKRKSQRGSKRFELKLELRPKGLIEKIMLDKNDFYNWYKGDLIEIEYLKRTKKVLHYCKIEDAGNT